jgi:RNA polymerase sigma factor for flagellar operon FliA
MQRKVLALYYFEDLRLREIAEVFGLTESRICQIHSQAILALRGYLQRMVADDR